MCECWDWTALSCNSCTQNCSTSLMAHTPECCDWAALSRMSQEHKDWAALPRVSHKRGCKTWLIVSIHKHTCPHAMFRRVRIRCFMLAGLVQCLRAMRRLLKSAFCIIGALQYLLNTRFTYSPHTCAHALRVLQLGAQYMGALKHGLASNASDKALHTNS